MRRIYRAEGGAPTPPSQASPECVGAAPSRRWPGIRGSRALAAMAPAFVGAAPPRRWPKSRRGRRSHPSITGLARVCGSRALAAMAPAFVGAAPSRRFDRAEGGAPTPPSQASPECVGAAPSRRWPCLCGSRALAAMARYSWEPRPRGDGRNRAEGGAPTRRRWPPAKPAILRPFALPAGD